MGVVIFICLLSGPHARWVKKFLPNTTNRILFILIVSGIIVAWIVQAVEVINHGQRGQEYFPLAFAVLCGGALYRFIHVWWVKSDRPVSP
jgi:hypothetical protein